MTSPDKYPQSGKLENLKNIKKDIKSLRIIKEVQLKTKLKLNLSTERDNVGGVRSRYVTAKKMRG